MSESAKWRMWLTRLLAWVIFSPLFITSWVFLFDRKDKSSTFERLLAFALFILFSLILPKVFVRLMDEVERPTPRWRIRQQESA